MVNGPKMRRLNLILMKKHLIYLEILICYQGLIEKLFNWPLPIKKCSESLRFELFHLDDTFKNKPSIYYILKKLNTYMYLP